MRAIQDRHGQYQGVAQRGWGYDSIYWWEARKRFVGLISRGFYADGKRVRPRVYGRTKTEVRDKLRKLKEQLDAEQGKGPRPGSLRA